MSIVNANKKYKRLKMCGLMSLVLSIVACSSSGGGGGGSQPDNSDNSDVVLKNGVVYTVDSTSSVAQAVAIRNGKIVYVGNNSGVAEYETDGAKVIDLKGKLVLPGLHDSHMHPLEVGSLVAGTCFVDPAADDIQSSEFTDKLKGCAPKQVGGIDWVLGFGHSVEQLLELPASVTPASILDAAVPDKPMVIMEETSHSMWANSKALQMAGIDKNTPNPVGGVIVKGADGEPTGLLLDNAGDIVFEMAFLPPTKELAEQHYEGLLYALGIIRSNGITSIVNARVYTRRGYLDAWNKVVAEDALTARTVLSLWAYPTLLAGETDDDQIAQLSSLYRKKADDLLHISQIKFYSDGIPSNETAAMIDPYPVDEQMPFLVSADHRGLNYFDEARLTKYVTELEKVGFDMHIHAIGDRGVRESLNAIESAIATNGASIDRRHRLTHVEFVNPMDYGRFKELSVIADFQVAGDFTLPEPGKSADGYIPVRSIYDTGAKYTLSSDWDVSSLSPFTGMQNSLNRAEQSLPDVDAAIRGYTINAAYLMRSEDKTGSIEVGKLGDMIIIDQNIFKIPTADISKTKVLLTLLAGEEIYRRKNFKD